MVALGLERVVRQRIEPEGVLVVFGLVAAIHRPVIDMADPGANRRVGWVACPQLCSGVLAGRVWSPLGVADPPWRGAKSESGIGGGDDRHRRGVVE